MTQETRQCQSCKKDFTLEAEDLALYEQAGVPPTEDCYECRWSQLLSFWILGRFRVGKSALSGKQLITVLPEKAQFPIYERDEFIGDGWDPLSYGREYDSSRSFLAQLIELQKAIPHPHQLGSKNVDCDWTDDWWESKNCYLCRSGYRCEDLCYGYRVINVKDSVDLVYAFDTEKSYDCAYCKKCYKVRHSFNVQDCVESAFLYDCRNCSNCFMSWNLRNKQYCILNKQYTKEEYFEKVKEFKLDSYKNIQALKKEFWNHIAKEAVHRENLNTQVANSTGNFLTEDKNCVDCAFFEKSENSRHVFRGFTGKDSIEGVSVALSERSTRSVLDHYSYGSTCTLQATNCRYSTYLDACEDCEYCFGCIGLRKKKYCILNKQYTEEAYKTLVEKIKSDMKARGEWGKFLPREMAYGGYNVSLAHLMFPKKKEEVIASGGRWEEMNKVTYDDAIKSETLPDSTHDVPDDITKKRIVCSESGLSYNIAARELAFYREHGIPLPQRHFDVRVFDLFRPMTLMFRPHPGTCFYCKKEITHYYDSSLGFEKIACIDCYQKNIA